MDKPKLYIEHAVYSKINYFVQNNDHEIGGMGLISYNKEQNYFYIREAFLLDQEVTSVTTDLDASAVGKLTLETMEQEGDLNFWWHSHVNMSVFWSGTDLETIKKFGNNGFLLATVFNKKKEMRTALAYRAKSDFGESLVFIDEIETMIYDSRIDEIELDKEIKAKVRQKSFSNFNFGEKETKKRSKNKVWKWDSSSFSTQEDDRKSILSNGNDLITLREAMRKRKGKINTELVNIIDYEALRIESEGWPRYTALEAAILGVTPEILRATQDDLTYEDNEAISELWDEYYNNGQGWGNYGY